MSPLAFIKNIAWYGTSPRFPHWKNRTIINTNGMAFILAAVAGLLTVATILTHPFERAFLVLIFMTLFNVCLPWINKAGHYTLSRHLLTLNAIVGALTITLLRKLTPAGEDAMGLFYQPRAAMLVMAIIPFVVFHFSERRHLIINLLIGFLGLVLFDPIHIFFGVGYYQLGHPEPDYYFTNVIYLCLYFFVVIGVGFLKRMMETYERRNEELIEKLNAAKRQAEAQNEQLESKSYILSQLLDKKDNDLTDITEELARYNQELMQYSYTISHNLRGPVASMLGLLELQKLNTGDLDTRELLDHMEKSVLNLDHIIRDLNRIVDERQNKFHVREDVNLETETNLIMALLDDHIHDYGVTIRKDFSRMPAVFAVQARINYILLSLISNAIQYRSPDRAPEIWLSSYPEKDCAVIEVRDNGVGINMKRYQERLFKPFQRFHPHASGKGLSLYLAKLQIEKMNGRITVESSRDIGTSFKVYLQNTPKEDR
ncbi:sensor histidine kinase [Chryseolinea soli]|uniref:histidine kinase n=1 Tax=Chryseolinea soli TaxID=2321403 RepID=A0A385SVE2_9BACT|nr:HAMP domain-containing sensor histidine kinase [Chryseolinea soli]AYB34127.1 sensor histidine kinase [Chryseolinea soli]